MSSQRPATTGDRPGRPAPDTPRLTGESQAWTAARVLLGLFLAVGAAAQSPRDLVQQGHAHYRAGQYAEALASYEKASNAAGGQSPELCHDLAAAHFKLGQIDDARDLWIRIKEARDATFEARTRYNLANCDYADALAAGQEDATKALELLGQASEQYRQALRLDSSLTDARANLELAQLLKQQIEAQQQSQPQTQQSCSQPGDEQKKDEQPPSTQPSESQDQQEQESQQEQASTSPSSQPQQSPDPNEPQEQEEEQEQKQEQAAEPQPASQTETQPAQTQPVSAEPTEAVHLSPEQAERLLQMIRDAEKSRREKLLKQQAAKQKPVERDW